MLLRPELCTPIPEYNTLFQVVLLMCSYATIICNQEVSFRCLHSTCMLHMHQNDVLANLKGTMKLQAVGVVA